MLNYQSPASKPFLMIPKEIDNDLSPEAFFLLVKLMKLDSNEDNSNDALRKKTNFSKRVFTKAKAELIEEGYLDTKQLYGNYYALYIGKQSVLNYRRKFKKSDNRHDKNQINKIEKSLL